MLYRTYPFTTLGSVVKISSLNESDHIYNEAHGAKNHSSLNMNCTAWVHFFVGRFVGKFAK